MYGDATFHHVQSYNNGSSGDHFGHYYISHFPEGGSPHSSFVLTRYRYTMSCSGGGGGGEEEDDEGGVSCELNETEEPFATAVGGYTHYDVTYDTSLAWPTADEFRPANIAVKFMIKAK